MSVKRSIRRAITHLGRVAFKAVPYQARCAVFDGWLAAAPREHKAYALSAVAGELNVERFVATGDYGEITSAYNDRTVFLGYARDKCWSPLTVEAFRKFFAERGGTYIDIGANIGLTIVPVARPGVRSFAFEPDPVNFANLRRNVAQNCASASVTLFEMALADRAGTMELEVRSGNLGDQRLRTTESPAEPETQIRTVQVAALDSLKLDIFGPLAVKVDTQGAEAMVFAGGAATLANADLLVTEFWPWGMVRLGGDPTAMLSILANNFAIIRMKRGVVDEFRVKPGFLDEYGDALPAADAADLLARNFGTDKADPYTYFDLLCTK